MRSSNMPLRTKSCFKNLLLEYRKVKIASGTKDVSVDRYISYFDDFISNQNINEIVFTKDMNAEWIKPRNKSEGNYVRYTRVNFSIAFLSFIKSLGYDVHIPRRLPFKATRFTAHIYSEHEIEKYFEYIDMYENRNNLMAAIYTPVIFRILYGCGTRVGETLSLKVQDVDLENGVLFLKETKNDRYRAVPVSKSLLKVLVKYSEKCLYLKRNQDFFFSYLDGRRVGEQSIYLIHRKALEYAGIPYIGSNKGPRVHDWRHTMAVTVLERFDRNKCDLYNVLPILKQYLGHVAISSTEQYLQLVEMHFDSVLSKTLGTEMKVMGETVYEE